MKAIINITMTAICRPEIVERTLKSFCENMLWTKVDKSKDLTGDLTDIIVGDLIVCGGKQAEVTWIDDEKLYVKNPEITYNFFVNVDPVGDPGVHPEEIIDLVKKYFPLSCGVVSPTPNFGEAFKQVWSMSANTPADFTFHLEDDWELRKIIDFGNMIRIMHKYPHLMCMRLNAFHGSKYHSKQWDRHFIPWNGVFYQIPSFKAGLLGFAGHPSLIRQEFVKRVAPILDPTRNPEKQIKGKNKEIKDLFEDPHIYGVYGRPGTGPVVFDIGSKWRAKSKWRKAGSKAHFTEYEEKKS